MKLKDMPKEELEILSYNDLAYMLLKENKKKMNTPQIFKFICELLDYSDDEYTAKIGDFYTSLTTDKRFVLLDNVDWDLREHRKVEIVMDDDEDDEIDMDSEEEEIDEEESEDTDLDSNLDEDLEDDMDDLAIVDEEELDEEN